jgi:hypothetical protein
MAEDDSVEALRATSDLLVEELRRELLRPRAIAPVEGSAACVLVETALPAHLSRMLDLASRAAPRAAQHKEPSASEQRTWASERARLVAELAGTRESAERAREEKEKMVGALADVVRRVSAERDNASAALSRLQRSSRCVAGGASARASDGHDTDEGTELANPAGDGSGLALSRKLVELRRELRALAVERAALLHGVAAAETVSEARRLAEAADAPVAAHARDSLAAAQAAIAAVVESRAAERLRVQLDAAEAVCARQADELAQAEEDAQVAQAFYRTQLATAEHAATDARARAACAEAAAEAALGEAARVRARATDLEAQLRELTSAEGTAPGASADDARIQPPLSAPSSPPGAALVRAEAARADRCEPQWRGFLWPRLGDLFGVNAPPREAASGEPPGRVGARERAAALPDTAARPPAEVAAADSPSAPAASLSAARAGSAHLTPLAQTACAPAAAADDSALAALLMAARIPSLDTALGTV